MKKYLAAGLSLFAVLSLSIYFRCYPIFFPQFDQYAAKVVDQQIQQKIAQEINKTNPGLGDLSKARLFETALAVYKKENKKSLKLQKKEEFAKLKDRFQDKFGQTYLMELDCWHWARYVQNIDRLGRVGDEIKDGKEHDNLMLFPVGNDINWSNLLHYASWVLYKVFTFFKPIPLFNFLFYLPIFFMAIFIILLYLFCYRNWGTLVAIVCCVFVGTGPILIPRSSAGWFDFDILAMIFPLLIVWTYLLAYNAASWPRSVCWVVLSALWLSLFCATWIGWAFILAIIIFYEIIVLGNCLSERLQYGQDTSAEIKKHLIISLVFLFSGAFWIILISGLTPLWGMVMQFKAAVSLNKPFSSLIWPNTLATVGELKNGDYLSIAKAIGGFFPLALALFSMLGVFLNIKKYKGIKRELLIMLVVWFMTMFFFCSRGIRFTMFLLVPMGIFLGWGIEEIYKFLMNKKWKLGLIPLGLVVIGMSVALISSADFSARGGTLPLIDDAWYSALTTIKKYTPADSVINSWWDFGDWFKVIAQRRVIFDGQTQNTPQAYWMARVLLTDSEKEAIGVLRMLNNGGNTAFEIIDQQVKNPFLSISLVKRAILLEPEEGRSLLATYLPSEAVENAARILYMRPKQKAYFIVDSSMIGKIAPISYLGNWDFLKVYLSRVVRIKSREQIIQDLIYYGLDPNQAQRYYREASVMINNDFEKWVSRKSWILGIDSQKKSNKDLVFFNSGYIYDLNRKEMYVYSSREGRYRVPKSLFLAEGNNISEEVYPESDSDYSALLLEDQEKYNLISLSPELGRSIFARLQFLNGRGLKHFTLFTREEDGQNQILVYEVKWE